LQLARIMECGLYKAFVRRSAVTTGGRVLFLGAHVRPSAGPFVPQSSYLIYFE